MNSLSLLPHQRSERPLDLPYGTFQDLLRAKAEQAPERDFLIFPESGRIYTYGAFRALSIATADWLTSSIVPFGTISILFRNTPEFLAIFFGAVAHGVTVVPINPDLAAPEIRFIVENSASTVVFYDPDMGAKLKTLEAEMSPGSEVHSGRKCR